MRRLIKKTLNKYIDHKSSKTKRNFFIIESDDWGSVRTKNKTCRDKLNKISELVAKDAFTQVDNIACDEDLSELYEVLYSVKDLKGNPACLTPNVCTANPDFEAIKADNYEQFYYKSFYETLKDHSTSHDLFTLWDEGINNKVFKPQLHGREHLHALAWLAELKAGNKELLSAFEYESFGIPYNPVLKKRRNNLQAALDSYQIKDEFEFQTNWIKESAVIFEKSFGYKAKSFIAPAYTWHSNFHKELSQNHIESLQGIKLQYEPNDGMQKKYNKRLHYTGQIDKKTKLYYTVRNAFFEPAPNPGKDWVNMSLKQIDNAFSLNQPVILSSHRINFIGSLNKKNRRENLVMLRKILKTVTDKYPEIEFISSDQLINYI